MKSSRLLFLFLVIAIAGFVVAGTKVSRLTRTTALASNDLFIVVTGTTAKVTRHIQAKDMAIALGPWITNASSSSGSGSGGAVTGAYGATWPITLTGTNFGANTNFAILSNEGKGTNTDFYGNIELLTGGLFVTDTSYFSNIVTIVELQLPGYPNVNDELDALQGKQNGSGVLTNVANADPFAHRLWLNTNDNISLAISNAPDNTLIELGAGTFSVTPSIPESNGLAAINIFTKNRLKIKGQGEGKTILDAGTTLGALFYVTNSSWIELSDMTLKGYVLTNYTQFTAAYNFGAFQYAVVDNLDVRRVHFDGGFNHGIIDDGATSGKGRISTNNITVEWNRFSNFGSYRTNISVPLDGSAIVLTGGRARYNVVENSLRAVEPYNDTDAPVQQFQQEIIGNWILNTHDTAILTAGSTNGHKLIIKDNYIVNTPGYTWRGGSNTHVTAAGININGGQAPQIIGNVVRGFPYAGIAIGGSHINDAVIRDNYVDLIGMYSGNTTGFGYLLGNENSGVFPLRNLVFKNNRSTDTRNKALYVISARDSVFEGNTFIRPTVSPSEPAVFVHASTDNKSTNLVFRNNMVINQTNGAMPYGFAFTSGGINIKMENNTIVAPTTGNINNGIGAQLFEWNSDAGSTNEIVRMFVLNQASNYLYSISGGGGGGPGTLPMNANQFNTNSPVSIISGALLTNLSSRGLTIPSITTSRALAINSSGNITNSATTETELGYLSGVTSAIQTQLSNDVRVAQGSGITVTPSGSGGIMTYTVAATGGSGATNNPVTLSAGTLTLVASSTAHYYTNSSGSFPFTFSGTADASAKVSLAISNTSSSIIYATNTSGIYDPTVASNVTTFAVEPTSQRTMFFRRNATSGWEMDGTIGKEMELAAGYGTSLATNSAGTILTNGVSTVLQGLHANPSTTVTNENSSQITISSGVLTLTSGSVLDNLAGSGVAPAGTNASASIASESGLGTNATLKLLTTISGSILADGSVTNTYSWQNGSNYFGGRVQIASGSPGNRKVFTSDASGNADWQYPGFQAGTVSGVGGANTNFTIQASGPDPIIYIDAGTTNVNIVAIMGYSSTIAYRGTIILTNRTATARTLSFGATTNNWINLQEFDDITAPLTCTNNQARRLDWEILGTNAMWASKPMALPSN